MQETRCLLPAPSLGQLNACDSEALDRSHRWSVRYSLQLYAATTLLLCLGVHRSGIATFHYLKLHVPGVTDNRLDRARFGLDRPVVDSEPLSKVEKEARRLSHQIFKD